MNRVEKKTAPKKVLRYKKFDIRLARSEHYYVADLEIDLFSECIKSVVVRQPQRGGRHA
jgi:hypothetical protein